MDKDEIRAIRKKLRLSQESFAQKIGVSWVSVNRWESGKNEPKQEHIDKILDLIKMGDE